MIQEFDNDETKTQLLYDEKMEKVVDDAYDKELKSHSNKKKMYMVKLKNGDNGLKPPVLIEREDLSIKIKI